MEFCSFASSSEGNSYLIREGNTNILCDAGTAGKNIKAGLARLGMTYADLDAVVVTHEHTDHIKSIKMVARGAENAGIYMSGGTFAALPGKLRVTPDKLEMISENLVEVSEGNAFRVGDVLVTPFAISHDAREPLGFTFSSGGRKLSIVTDTGIVTDEMLRNFGDSDACVLEANHEKSMLINGPYPYDLKQRIASRYGHLSNDAAARIICEMADIRDKRGKRDHTVGFSGVRVMLGHLSPNNNTPGQALVTVKNVLFENDRYVGEDLDLIVAPRKEPSGLIEV